MACLNKNIYTIFLKKIEILENFNYMFVENINFIYIIKFM